MHDKFPLGARRGRIRIAAASLALVLAAPLAGSAAERSPRRASDEALVSSSRLVGTWEFEVTFVTCDTGTPVAPPFRSLHTYLPGGSALEQGATVGPPPTASRTVGQGIWQRSGPGVFESRFTFFTFDANGQNLGRVQIEEILEFQGGNDVLAYGVGKVFTPTGLQVASNCFVSPGVRQLFED